MAPRTAAWYVIGTCRVFGSGCEDRATQLTLVVFSPLTDRMISEVARRVPSGGGGVYIGGGGGGGSGGGESSSGDGSQS